jgi:hypothetical protein
MKIGSTVLGLFRATRLIGCSGEVNRRISIAICRKCVDMKKNTIILSKSKAQTRGNDYKA